MGRFPQPVGQRGSLKWIQRAVNHAPHILDDTIMPKLGRASRIAWVSPLQSDEYAEYRDGAFLARLGLPQLSADLASFWPARGPQWDALARSDAGDVLLVEAKAHVAELCSPGAQAGASSLEKIRAALVDTANSLGAKPLAEWHVAFYQFANRLAHLHFLRSRGIPAWLIFVNFLGDDDMGGPRTAEGWRSAYTIAAHVMGLPKRHNLSRYIVEVFPVVAMLKYRPVP